MSPRSPLTRREFVQHAAALGIAVPWVRHAAAWVRRQGAEFTLAGDGIALTWTVAKGSFRPVRAVDTSAGTPRPLPIGSETFALRLNHGTVLRASQLRLMGDPVSGRLDPDPRAARYAERLPGRHLTLELEDPERGLRVTWRGVVRDGSTYVRQEVTLRAVGGDLPIAEIALVDAPMPGAAVSGSVAGSPIVCGTTFVAFEHPLSAATVEADRARCILARTIPLRHRTTLMVSSVVGVTPPGQLRRGFLQYVERERAHPYRTFLHYNSWYDLGYFSRYDEAGALGVIKAFGTELHERRGVTLSSFLFDDGWDDPHTLWRFNRGFPHGFTPLKAATARYGAAPGVWLSPWGGYGEPRRERLAYGKAQGFEINEHGFALSGPKYYRQFHDRCVDFIETYGVNQFKFDGTANATRVTPDSPFDSDFDAMLHLIADLRTKEPDLYVNLTTGTYPSPFWLRHADSIWRGGDDHDFAGAGSNRQQWITYRDGDTYRGIVVKGPLFPLNSLMLHGLIYAQHAKNLDTDPGNDFPSEIQSYFGTGTQLQEMYVTARLLSNDDWDILARTANWSRANADVLIDTHWVGGDPFWSEPYGWASWSHRKGILVLRNPSAAPATLELDIGAAMELPANVPTHYRVSSPWPTRGTAAPKTLDAGTAHAFTLKPFEVRTLELTP